MNDKNAYPKDGRYARQGHMVATITYADGEKAKLIYLKTVLMEGVSFKVKGHAAQNRDFPDQSTADQFFDEVQFESYRELGFRIAHKMLQSRATEPFDDCPSAQTLEEMIRECAAAQRS